MTVIARRLMSHLQNDGVPGLLEKATMALKGYVPEQSLTELDRLMRIGSWNNAGNLMASMLAQNEHDKGLIKRLEMILFFHERRPNNPPVSDRETSSVVRNDDSGYISDADLSFLENEAASLPGLDHDDMVGIRQDGAVNIFDRDQDKDTSSTGNADEGSTIGQSTIFPQKQRKRTFQDEIDGLDEAQSPKRMAVPNAIKDVEKRSEQAAASNNEANNSVHSGPPNLDLAAQDSDQDLDYLEEVFLNDEVLDTSGLLEADGYQIFEVDMRVEVQPGEVDHDFGDEYAAYAYDPDEIYDALEDQKALKETRLSREDRARQVAAELIARTEWTPEALPLLQQIFYTSGWSATRVSLEREINHGLTLDELILASHLKVIWSENENYWIAFDKNGNGLFSHYILSWPTALLVVRTYEAMPQIEELEAFVGTLYEHWIESLDLTRAFRSFSRYLWFRTARLEGCLPPDEPFSFGSPHALPEEEYSDIGYYDYSRREIQLKLNELGTYQIMAHRKDSLSFGAWCEYADQLDLETIHQVMNSDISSSDECEEADMELDNLVESENDK